MRGGSGGVKPVRTKPGVKPIPTRWKGFYRALKRKEEWAIKLKGNYEIGSMGFLLRWTYSHPAHEDLFKAMIYSENPFIKILAIKNNFSGNYIPILIHAPKKENK